MQQLPLLRRSDSVRNGLLNEFRNELAPMSIQPFEQRETAGRSNSCRKRSVNLTFGFGIAQEDYKILEHRRNRLEPSGEPGG